MYFRPSIAAIVAVCLIATPVSRASAGAEDIVGGIIGGVVAGAIMSQPKQQVRTRTVTKVVRAPSPGVSSAVREQNRQVQVALNYFGFPAGPADGVIGSRSRAAISDYQIALGFPITGELNQFEKDFLLRSHSRAQAGGYATQQQVAALAEGPRGLLKQYRTQEMQGAAMVPTAPAMVAQPAQPLPPAPATAAAAVVNAATAPMPSESVATSAAAETASPSVPNFMAGQAEASVTSHCNMVNLQTSTSGGFVTLASMSDPRQALDEQFCVARTLAIARGDTLISKVQGISPAQITEQCKQFAPLMKPFVSALSFKSPADVMTDVGAFVVETGAAPGQLAGTAEICLSVGYRTDDLSVILGSALLLTVLGEQPYAELMGHHILNGLGASRRTDLALAWYAVGVDALDNGATPVFAATAPERTQLIAASVTTLAGGRAPHNTVVEGDTSASVLPTFAISE